ncbi:hypothetical protein [Glycomyces halotolerans]
MSLEPAGDADPASHDGHSYPPPPVPPKQSSGVKVLAIVGALVLLLVVAAAGTWWWSTHDRAGTAPGEATEAAGEARFEDHDAGVSFVRPDGWEPTDSAALIDAFTSYVGIADGSAWVATFHGEAMTDEEMSYSTSVIAEENSEYFYPLAEEREVLHSESARIDGLEAHDFAWLVDKADDEPMYGRAIHILTDDGRSVFVMGFVHPDDAALRAEVDAVLASVSMIEAG